MKQVSVCCAAADTVADATDAVAAVAATLCDDGDENMPPPRSKAEAPPTPTPPAPVPLLQSESMSHTMRHKV